MSENNKIHRRKFVTVRVTQEEKDQFAEKAKQADKDVSTYVRELVLPNSVEAD